MNTNSNEDQIKLLNTEMAAISIFHGNNTCIQKNLLLAIDSKFNKLHLEKKICELKLNELNNNIENGLVFKFEKTALVYFLLTNIYNFI